MKQNKEPRNEPSCCCSVTKSYLTLCDPVKCNRSGFLVLHIFLSLLKLMSIESLLPSNHLIIVVPFSFCPQCFPAQHQGIFQWIDSSHSAGQSIGVSVSPSALPPNIQSFYSLRLTGLIPLLSKRLLRVFSSTTVWKHQFFVA